MPGVRETGVTKDMLKFYARTEGVHKIFLLMTTDAGPSEQVASEVLKSIRNRMKV